MNAIYVLWLRELKRFIRSKAQIFGSLAQPVFYIVAFGFGFNPVFEKAGEGSYLQFMVPGVLGMTVLLSAIFSGITVLWDRQFGFLKESLVAPVPRIYIMLGRTLGGATVGVVQGALILLVCVIMGFRPQNWTAILSSFSFVVLISISFSAIGMTLGSLIKNMQSFHTIGNVLIMPLVFLSGSIYPLSHLPTFLSLITRINPLSYGVDGLRGTLTGQWHFNYFLDISLLCCLSTIFLIAGAYLFSRLEA
jgi:ABC-2 type transport system permease protein